MAGVIENSPLPNPAFVFQDDLEEEEKTMLLEGMRKQIEELETLFGNNCQILQSLCARMVPINNCAHCITWCADSSKLMVRSKVEFHQGLN